jgi:hypothetical protein
VRAYEEGGGAAMDLFWSPPDARWSGDETAAYELVYAKIHGRKAYVRLRQAKSHPALDGIVLTKTISIPERGTDIEVRVEIENPGPTPEVRFVYWAHQMFTPGREDLKDAAPERKQGIYMERKGEVLRAPVESIVWAKPGQPFSPGAERFESENRDGVTTADWIAHRNPVTGAAVLCQVREGEVAQFYSWRQPDGPGLSSEWMYPPVILQAGESWKARYDITYLRSVKPDELQDHLAPTR